MKPIKNIVIILAVIGLLIGGFYWVNNFQPKEKTDDSATPSFAPSVIVSKIERDSIQKVTVNNEGETFTISKNGEDWLLNNDADVKLTSTGISSFLYDCATISAKEIIEENVTDFSVYGLDQPKRSVVIECSDGNTLTALVGNSSIDGSICYLMMEGQTTVYAKSSSGCSSLVIPMSKLLEKSIYSIGSDSIGTISLHKTGTEKVRLVNAFVKETEEGKIYEWRMEAPLIKVANDYNIREQMIEKIASLSANEVIPFPSDATDYGFASPQAVYTVSDLENTTSYTVTVGKDTDDGNTYVKLSDSKTVYTVPKDSISFIHLNYQQLVDSLVHVENIIDIAEINISGLGKSYHLTISGSDDNATYKINDKDIEEKSFKKAYQTIIGLSLSSFSKNPVTAASEFTIVYTKNDGTQVTVECIPYDDRNYVTKVNGEGNLVIRR